MARFAAFRAVVALPTGLGPHRRLADRARAGTVGALLVGEHAGGELRYLDKVGTGFDDRAHLGELMRVAATDAYPFHPVPIPAVPGAPWALPRLVGEVKYATRTRTERLRHPSWHRLRPDLAPDDTTL